MTEQQFITDYRSEHPESRIIEAFRFHRNTGSVKQRRCVYCGEVGPSWSANWPKTKRAEVWEQSHRESHFKGGE